MRIANTVDDSIVDGPGLRFAVFTQGCAHACPGCHNPATHDPAGGQEIPVEDVAAQFGHNPLTEGLTLSGGEPFLQGEDCAKLAARAHQVGWTVWVYTGFLYEAIAKSDDPAWQALLAQTDVLVDGPYVASKGSYSLPFRGSTNQRLIDVAASRRAGRVVHWVKNDGLDHFAVPES